MWLSHLPIHAFIHPSVQPPINASTHFAIFLSHAQECIRAVYQFVGCLAGRYTKVKLSVNPFSVFAWLGYLEIRRDIFKYLSLVRDADD